MIKFLLKLAFFITFNGVIFYALDEYIFLEKFTVTGGLWGYGLAAFFFGMIHTIILPILRLVTLPLRILTLGAINLVLNAFLLIILQEILLFLDIKATTLVIDGWFTFVIAGLLLSIANAIFDFFKK